MNVLVARNIGECAAWTGTAVIIDVLRTATTVCALLAKGERNIVVCPDSQTAERLKSAYPAFTLMTELPLSQTHEDDSPYLAGKLSPHTPILLAGNDTGRALQQVRRASAVLLGGFCNFRSLVQQAQGIGKDILLVPATIFSGQENEEDVLCAQAFKEFVENISQPGKFIGELQTTVRLVEFSEHGPKTAAKDLELALTLNEFSVVPQAAYPPKGNWAVCVPLGKKPDPAWATFKEIVRDTPKAQELQFKTMIDLNLRPMVEKTLLNSQLMPQPAVANQQVPSVDQSGKSPVQKTVGMPDLTSNKPADAKPARQPVPEDPTGPEVTRSVLKPKKTPRQTPNAQNETEISLADGTTTWQISKPRPGLEQANAADSMFADLPVSPAPESQEPASLPESDQRERVLELSVLKEGDTVEAKPALMHRPSAGKRKKAIVLFSGGLDSTTCLHWAIARGYECEALTVSYGQRHLREVVAAQTITRKLHIKHHLIDLKLPWLTSSSLVDDHKPLPDVAVEQIPQHGIPSTYVPGRNLMFLSIAGSLLDSVGADAIVAGPNAVDFSGYPDCTPAFFKAAGEALNRGTQRGVREGIDVLAPLMHLSKAEIVRLAVKLHVPLELTWSCYAGGDKPCGKCDSCKLRAKGFAQAGIKDPAL